MSERRARWSGCRRSSSTRSARPATIPACGPPSSLSPEKQTRSAPAARAAAGVGSPSTSTSAPEPRSSRSGSSWRRATAASSSSRGCSVKPTTRKFDWCTRSSSAVLGPDRPLVVGRPGPVRRPDLDEAGARACEHVGDPEAVADLDQLAARDDDLATLRERGEREQHRGGVVVDDDRGLGAGQPAQQRRQVVLARAARAGGEVVLEIRVAARGRDPVERGLRQRCAAEIRVHEHAGRVEDAAQRRPACCRERFAEPGAQVARLRPGPDLLPRALEHLPRGRDRERVVAPAHELVHRRKVSQPHGHECNPASAATLQIMRRVGLITGAALACVAVRPSPRWPRATPTTGTGRCRASSSARRSCRRRSTVVVGGKAYEVKPAEVLRLDGTATEQARWDAGRTSFTARMRAARRPQPADPRVDPVLVSRPQLEDVAARVSAALPKPRRAQVVVDGSFASFPSRTGRRGRPRRSSPRRSRRRP